MTDNIEVTQADREVVANYAEADGEFYQDPKERAFFIQETLAGRLDGEMLIQAYARHRIASVAEVTAQRDELLESAKDLASDVQCLVDCRSDCGEWGSECPLQDAHKPDSTIDRLQRLLDAIAKAEGRV